MGMPLFRPGVASELTAYVLQGLGEGKRIGIPS
jgi:hypothetical protein